MADSPSSVILTIPVTTASTRSWSWTCAGTIVPGGQAHEDTWYPYASTLWRSDASVTGPSRRGSHRSMRMTVSIGVSGGQADLGRRRGRRRRAGRLDEQPQGVAGGAADGLVV